MPDEHTPPDVPPEVRELISGLALAAAAANVVMQLAKLPIGHGVAESRVDSGRLDLHPVKRTRTTLAYLTIALLGTEHERSVMRNEVNRAHRDVHSLDSSPVPYDAFDVELQLWVAACLYQGAEDVARLCHQGRGAGTERGYRHAARLATTLQVPEHRWPPDRDAFEAWWKAELDSVEMDAVTRRYLLDLVDLRILPAPLRWLFGPPHRFITTGFLAERFRDELGLTWSPRRQRAFERGAGVVGSVHRLLPRVLRELPLNLALWDTRRRIRSGRPIV